MCHLPVTFDLIHIFLLQFFYTVIGGRLTRAVWILLRGHCDTSVAEGTIPV
jgi:hypothetical protein